jgi:hypothetical protein
MAHFLRPPGDVTSSWISIPSALVESTRRKTITPSETVDEAIRTCETIGRMGPLRRDQTEPQESSIDVCPFQLRALI